MSDRCTNGEPIFLKSMPKKIAYVSILLASAFGVKKKNIGMNNKQTMGAIAFKFGL